MLDWTAQRAFFPWQAHIRWSADAVLTSPQRRNTALVYVNFFQMPDTLQEWPNLVVRVRREAATTNNDIRQAVERSGREWNQDLAVTRARARAANSPG